jgi:hypothetical protein
MGTPQWYQNLVAKPAQTNYSVGSHYIGNRLRQPAVRAATGATIALWIISSELHSSNPPNIFKHFDPRAHANWHFEGYEANRRRERTTSQGALVFLLWRQGPQLKQLPFETSGAKGAQISIHLEHFWAKTGGNRVGKR